LENIELVDVGPTRLQSWKCSGRLQKSIQNRKADGHFTLVCSVHCMVWYWAWNPQALS